LEACLHLTNSWRCGPFSCKKWIWWAFLAKLDFGGTKILISRPPWGPQGRFKNQCRWNSICLSSQALKHGKWSLLGDLSSENLHFFQSRPHKNREGSSHDVLKLANSCIGLQILQAWLQQIRLDICFLLAAAKIMELWNFLCFQQACWPNLQVGSRKRLDCPCLNNQEAHNQYSNVYVDLNPSN